MKKEFDLLVFIGRFQPFHKGHEHVILEALQKTNELLILVGSSNMSRSIRNPFSFDERREMIATSNQTIKSYISTGRLTIEPLNDSMYNDTGWIADVQSIVSDRLVSPYRTGLVGFSKDHSSYYLKMFPSWGAMNIESQYSTFNSTNIRNNYFRPSPMLPIGICPVNVVQFLEDFMLTPKFSHLVAEGTAIRNYKKSWGQSPFPPVFICVDNIVVQSGHILLVRRGEMPGKGLLALPGGFLDVKETLVESAVRELKEETKIADHIGEMPPAKLRSFITKKDVFDDPDRSTRGRTVTHAFLYNLPNSNPLYKVIGSDDAVSAKWYPIGTLNSNLFFEDHYFIMNKMLGLSS